MESGTRSTGKVEQDQQFIWFKSDQMIPVCMYVTILKHNRKPRLDKCLQEYVLVR